MSRVYTLTYQVSLAGVLFRLYIANCNMHIDSCLITEVFCPASSATYNAFRITHLENESGPCKIRVGVNRDLRYVGIVWIWIRNRTV